MNSIYQDIILDHYKNPRNFGKLKRPYKAITVSNPFCGDKIQMMIRFEKNKIKDIKFNGIGCAISTASASMLTDYAKNKKKIQIKKLDKDFIQKMIKIQLSPVRLKCALLPLEAIKKLIKIP